MARTLVPEVSRSGSPRAEKMQHPIILDDEVQVAPRPGHARQLGDDGIRQGIEWRTWRQTSDRTCRSAANNSKML